jgi:SsrA-binding protein
MSIVMSSQKKHQTSSILNRRARHDYALEDEIVAGISLTGAETKALRMGHGHLKGSYVTLRNGELWLINATITGTGSVRIGEDEQTRPRKLLAKRREIEKLTELKQQGRTIVPLAVLTRGRYIKVRIAAGRGKKRYDKREVLKKRDQERAIRRSISNK